MFEDVERPGLVEGPILDRQTSQVTEYEVAPCQRLSGEERTDVDTGEPRVRVGIPDHRAPAPTTEIEHAIAWPEIEEPPQHVVPDSRSEQRRSDRRMPRVGVQRLVEILGLLRKCGAWAKVEVPGRSLEMTSAPPAVGGRVSEGDGSATVWTSDDI